MFRPMRRASRAIPEEAAKHLLQQSRRGVLAVNGDNGYPFAIPVNYYYDQEHDKIYFHGGKSGLRSHETDTCRKVRHLQASVGHLCTAQTLQQLAQLPIGHVQGDFLNVAGFQQYTKIFLYFTIHHSSVSTSSASSSVFLSFIIRILNS